eukprot:1146199-Pelagomonas_calceolata.AAC.4
MGALKAQPKQEAGRQAKEAQGKPEQVCTVNTAAKAGRACKGNRSRSLSSLAYKNLSATAMQRTASGWGRGPPGASRWRSKVWASRSMAGNLPQNVNES